MTTRTLTPPQPWPETQIYWEAAQQGKLLLWRCIETGRAFHYPRAHSPFTGRAAVESFEASGRATLYTFSTFLRGKPPYCLAYVTLEEGPTMMSNIITRDFARLQIGMALRLCFLAASDDQEVPVFTPCDEV